MHLEIISPEKVLFSGEAEIIQLPGTSGYFEILNNHAPIVSTLSRGRIKVKNHIGSASIYEIESGVIEAHHNRVSVLVET